MKILYWNIRGVGRKGRRRHLKEVMYNHKVYILCLQETMKEEFTIVELRGLEGG
jgi:exonuclease III